MSPNTPPKNETGKWASLGLTALVHLVLVLFLFFGVRWQSKPNDALEVSLVARNASRASTAPEVSPEPPKPAPPPPEREPKPEPKPLPPPPAPPKPQPKPQPKPEPRPEPKPEPKPLAKPEVAIKEPKKVEPKKPEPKPEPPKPEPKKPEPKKPEPEPRPEPKPEPTKVEPKKPEPKVEQPKPPAVDSKRLNDQMERDLAQARMSAMLKADTQRIADSRAAAASSAALGEYTSRIAAKVKSRLVPPPGVSGDPVAEFVVEQMPDGSVMSARMTRSSENPALDAAIERAIHNASPLPLPKDPSLFQRSLRLTFHPLGEN